jgi:hypothetical protein
VVGHLGGPTGARMLPPAACIRQDGAPVASYVLHVGPYRLYIGWLPHLHLSFGLGSYIGSYGPSKPPTEPKH